MRNLGTSKVGVGPANRWGTSLLNALIGPESRATTVVTQVHIDIFSQTSAQHESDSSTDPTDSRTTQTGSSAARRSQVVAVKKSPTHAFGTNVRRWQGEQGLKQDGGSHMMSF